MHTETHTRKLEYRVSEGRLVGYRMDSKSYRIYNTETRRVRSSRNAVFIETASVPSSLDERGFDDGEFTYDDHVEMLRDVRNYTFNHSVNSLSPEHAVGDPPVLELLEQVRQITDRDLGVSPAGPSPADGALETSGSTPCLLYTSPSPRDKRQSRMPSSA